MSNDETTSTTPDPTEPQKKPRKTGRNILNDPNDPAMQIPGMIADPNRERGVKTSRFTTHARHSHQNPGEQPVQVGLAFERRLETNEQPYARRMDIGPEPTPLDTGYLKEKVSKVYISNLSNSPLRVIFDNSTKGLCIPAKEDQLIEPEDVTTVKLAALGTDKIRIQLVCFPS